MPSVVVRCRDVAVVKGLGCRGAWKVGDGFLGAGGREVGVGSKKILISHVPGSLFSPRYSSLGKVSATDDVANPYAKCCCHQRRFEGVDI